MKWTAEQFTKEFEVLERTTALPTTFKKQIEKVRKIVNHWKECRGCAVGFYCGEHTESFEELFLKLAYFPIEYHTCKDFKYKLLFMR